MANKRQKKKAAKKLGIYEGSQYRGGRQGKRKNLKRVDGLIVNQHGVKFTPDEKRKLENLANRVNRKHNKMVEELGNLPHKVDGQDTGHKVSTLFAMGKESDFIIARKSKSLQRFQTRKQFDDYMTTLTRANSPHYLEERIRLYKRNFMTAVQRVYSWDEASDVIMKVRMMKPEDFMKIATSNEELEIGYIDSDGPTHGSLNSIRRALGMKPKDEDSFGYYEDDEEY